MNALHRAVHAKLNVWTKFSCKTDHAPASTTDPLPLSHGIPRVIVQRQEPFPSPGIPAPLISAASSTYKSAFVVFIRDNMVLCVETVKGKTQLPGGKKEDVDGNDPVNTAIRETHEEIGVLLQKKDLKLVGRDDHNVWFTAALKSPPRRATKSGGVSSWASARLRPT